MNELLTKIAASTAVVALASLIAVPPTFAATQESNWTCYEYCDTVAP